MDVLIGIPQLQEFMRSGETTLLCDVRGPAGRGGYIPTSLRVDFASGSLPFELERGAAQGAVIVLYEGQGCKRALAVRESVFGSRGRVFVLEGGFASYLAAVTDPSTGQPFSGSVVDYEPGAPLSEPVLSEQAFRRISSTPSLDEEQQPQQASAAAPKEERQSVSIDEQVSKFVGGDGAAGNPRRPVWTADALVESCPFCSVRFSATLRKHHCRACGQIFCFNCSRHFILLSPQYDYAEPERVCTGCVRRCSNLDYGSSHTLFTSKSDDPAPVKILMFGPEMATRKSMEDLANALRERYTVITYDLPGCGARDGEALTEEACRRLVEDSVENHATGGASVVLCGINLSAYVLLKSVAAVKQRKVFGLILIGAGKNYYQPSKLLLKGIGMLYKISPASRLWKYTVDELGGQSQLILPKERFEELFLRSPVDYSKWPESVAVMCAPTADFYPKCIEQFRNPILFLPSDKGKDDAGAFLAKSALGTVSSAAPHKHAYASPKFIPGIVAAIDHWIDTNKARLIIQDLDE